LSRAKLISSFSVYEEEEEVVVVVVVVVVVCLTNVSGEWFSASRKSGVEHVMRHAETRRCGGKTSRVKSY
jgi:hypothetical protein